LHTTRYINIYFSNSRNFDSDAKTEWNILGFDVGAENDWT